MTSSKFILNTLAANTDDLPRPDTNAGTIASSATTSTGLKRPVLDIADTGRISVGAAMRLPVTK